MCFFLIFIFLIVIVGFAESQEAYNPYPNALLSIRYINEVGKVILSDIVPDPGDVKEGDEIGAPEKEIASQDDSQVRF